MSKISLKGIASKMSADQMKSVTGGWNTPRCHQLQQDALKNGHSWLDSNWDSWGHQWEWNCMGGG